MDRRRVREAVGRVVESISVTKLQDPSTKLQGSSKLQLQNWNDGEYPEPRMTAWMLREDQPCDQPRHPFDLEERTVRFSERLLVFLRKVPRGPHNDRLIDQLVGCGTSIGANYCEANEAVSKKDFRNTVSRSVKEAKETKYFIRLVAASEPQLADEARTLYREAGELHLILSAMYRRSAPP
jgi:four helix bundle protein